MSSDLKPQSTLKPPRQISDRQLLRLSANRRRVIFFTESFDQIRNSLPDIFNDTTDVSMSLRKRDDERCTIILTYASTEDAQHAFDEFKLRSKFNAAVEVKYGDQVANIGNSPHLPWVRSRHVSVAESHTDEAASHSDSPSPQTSPRQPGEEAADKPPRRRGFPVRIEEKLFKLTDVPLDWDERQIMSGIPNSLHVTLAVNADGSRPENGLAFVRMKTAKDAREFVAQHKSDGLEIRGSTMQVTKMTRPRRQEPARVKNAKRELNDLRKKVKELEKTKEMEEFYQKFQSLVDLKAKEQVAASTSHSFSHSRRGRRGGQGTQSATATSQTVSVNA